MTAFGRPVKQGGGASKRGDRNVYVLSPESLECPTRPKAASESLSAPTPYPDASSPCYHSHHSYQITRPGGAYIAWSSARVRMPRANNWRGQKRRTNFACFRMASEPPKHPSAPTPQSRSFITIPTKSKTRAELTTPGLDQGLKCLREIAGGDCEHPPAC